MLLVKKEYDISSKSITFAHSLSVREIMIFFCITSQTGVFSRTQSSTWVPLSQKSMSTIHHNALQLNTFPSLYSAPGPRHNKKTQKAQFADKLPLILQHLKWHRVCGIRQTKCTEHTQLTGARGIRSIDLFKNCNLITFIIFFWFVFSYEWDYFLSIPPFRFLLLFFFISVYWHWLHSIF